MNEIISRSLQILPPGEQVRKTASFSFSTAYFSVEESEQRCVDTQVRRLCSTDWLTAWCVHVIRWCLQSRGLQVEATPRMVCVWDRFIQTFDRKTSLMYKLFKTNIIRRVHEHSVQISKAPFSSMYCIWCRLFFFKQKKLQNAVFVFFPAWLVMTEKEKKKTQIRQSQNKHLRNKLLYSWKRFHLHTDPCKCSERWRASFTFFVWNKSTLNGSGKKKKSANQLVSLLKAWIFPFFLIKSSRSHPENFAV